MTSCTYDMPRSACSAALETYHGASTIILRSFLSCKALFETLCLLFLEIYFQSDHRALYTKRTQICKYHTISFFLSLCPSPYIRPPRPRRHKENRTRYVGEVRSKSERHSSGCYTERGQMLRRIWSANSETMTRLYRVQKKFRTRLYPCSTPCLTILRERGGQAIL
jgi:hypothetical protein